MCDLLNRFQVNFQTAVVTLTISLLLLLAGLRAGWLAGSLHLPLVLLHCHSSFQYKNPNNRIEMVNFSNFQPTLLIYYAIRKTVDPG